MHEQSETIEQDGIYVNVYGKATPNAGKPLPLRYPFEKATYPTLDMATAAAQQRSDLEGQGLAGFIDRTDHQSLPTVGETGGELASWLNGDEETRKLRLSMQEGAKVDPTQATRVLQLQTKTGLPKDYLATNADDVESQLAGKAFNAEAFRKTSPSFAAWIAQHPDHAAAAREDVTKLNYLERQLRYIADQHQRGLSTVELADLGGHAIAGTITPEHRARQRQIEQQLKQPDQTDITGFVEQIPGQVANQLPIFARSLAGKVEHAGEGTTIGAAAGAAAGAATANPALPAAGALLGAVGGWRYGAAIEAGKIEMRLAYLDYEQLKDANGVALDRETILGLSGMVGVVNGALEGMTGVESLANKLPGIRNLTKDGILDLLKTPTSRAVLLTYAKQVGSTMATEGVTEALQSMVTAAGGVIAKATKDGGSPLDLLGRIFSPENMQQALQEGRAGAQGGGGIGAAVAAPAALADLQAVKHAQTTAKAFENIGAVASDTKLRDALPGTLRTIIENATKDGPLETLYIPLDSFNTYFQSIGVNPRDAAQAITGTVETYDHAMETGMDLAVPTADYAEKLAPTEHNAFFAQELRPSLDAMNAREADQWVADRMQEEQALAEQQAAENAADPMIKVRNDIAGQLESLGFDPTVVDQYAALFASRYQARAERRGLGEDPFELFQQQGLTVQRKIPDILTKVGGTTELDALLDRLRVSDLPAPNEIFGKSLFEALREHGGLQDQGGELSNLGIDQEAKPFVKKLLQPKGLTLDQAAERMAESGYIGERDINALLDAMGQEASGKPVYVPGAENLQLFDLAQNLEQLQRYLQDLGVNLDTMTNEQVKALLAKMHDVASIEGETFDQRDIEKKKLSALHNLSADNLIFADKMGGIPVPSVAIVPSSLGVHGYGDITLIGRKALADPETVPIHDADVYSPTFPTPEYPKVSVKSAQKLVDEIKPYAKRFQHSVIVEESWDKTVNRPDPSSLVQTWLNSVAAKALYLDQQGIHVDPVMRQADVELPWVAQPGFRDSFRRLADTIDNYSPEQRDHNPELQELSDLARTAIHQYIAEHPTEVSALREIYGEDAVAEHYGTAYGISGEWAVGTGSFPWTFLFKIDNSLRNVGVEEVDRSATREAMDRALSGKEIEFTQWAEGKITGLFGDPFLRIRGKKEAFSLSNIVEVMTGKVRAQEKTMTYGEGKARAAAAKQFKDLEQMRRAADNIVDESTIESARQEAKKLTEEYRENVVKYYGQKAEGSSEFGRVWEGMDASMRAMARWARGAKTPANMRRALLSEGFRVNEMNDWIFQEAVDAGNAFLKAPVPYFEAKPQRAVSLSEFAGAVIPTSSKQVVRDVLTKNGVPFQEYDTDDGQHAQQAITIAFRDKLSSAQPDVLFQNSNGSPLPKGSITFGKGSSPNILYQSIAPAQTFFSQVERVIEAKMPNKASAAQVRGILSPNNGVKPDELKWLGLDDYLKTKDAFTKQDVLDFVRQNQVQVQEVMKGEGSSGGAWSEENIQPQDNGQFRVWVEGPRGWVDAIVNSRDEAERWLNERTRNEDYGSGTKFQQYQIPGGTNYRELLLTLPENRLVYTTENVVPLAPGSKPEVTQPDLFWYFKTPDNVFQIPKSKHATEADALAYILKDKQPAPSVSDNFGGGHFSELNILAHVRFNDRTGPNGEKVLFLEEVQSDWHQKGKKQGYQGEPPAVTELPPGFNVVAVSGYWMLNRPDGGGRLLGPADGTVYENAMSRERAVELAIEGFQGTSGQQVPDAPFKKTWHELALKRMLRYAAEHDYDELAWTTGEQQAERYDLSKQVKNITYEPTKDGRYFLNVLSLDDGNVLSKEFSADELPNVVGKEVAEKIVNGEGRPESLHDPDLAGIMVLSGLDLKVGGEGMKGFYDQILPAFLNKYGKKWGAKVGAIGIASPTSHRWELISRSSGESVGGPFESREEAEAAKIPYGLPNADAQQIGGGETVHSLPITKAMKQSVLNEGQALFQSGDAERGMITFGKGRIDITLLERADLSTFIHETGHLYLNELIDDAFTPGTSEQLRHDLDTTLKWMGLDVTSASGAEAVRAAIGREHHEQFARGFEAYTLEGKSPSQAMREVFARFRQWLIQVYKIMTLRGGATPTNIGQALNVKLNPEVRTVLNRMVATEDEINAMESETDVLPLFTDAVAAGMSEREFANYRELIQKAGMTARETLQTQLMAQLAREKQAWWVEKRDEVKAQVTAETNQHRDYIALAVLQTGAMPDGTALPDGVTAGKLDRKAVAQIFGKDFVKRLPKGITAKEGITPAQAADLFGYDSVEAFLTALANIRPKKALIEAETDHRMTREYGDPLIDGTLHDKARAAVMNEDREQIVEAELAALNKKRREVAPFVRAAQAEQNDARKGALSALMPPADLVRTMARETVLRTPIRHLKPHTYFLAAQKANRDSIQAIAREDYVAAALVKQKELLNLATFKEATAALTEVERIKDHMQTLRRKPAQERLGKAGADYLEQVNAILQRYEFTPIPLIDLDRRQSLREWVAQKQQKGETLGEEFTVPDTILLEARRVNYREIPYEELLGLRDTIAQIEHFAQLKNKLLAQRAAADKAEARDLLIASVEAAATKRPPAPLTKAGLTRRETVSKWVREMDASLLKMEQIVEWLDGGPTGPWHDYLWNPAADAQHAENDYTATITAKIAAAVQQMPIEIRRQMLEPVLIHGLSNRITRRDLLGVALNMGNDSNKQKLLKGMEWSEDQVRSMLDQLTKDEWDFVQSIWDTLESMRPDIGALQKKLTGIEPEWITPSPIETRFGPYRGGYYPVIYSHVLSEQGAMQLASTIGKLTDENYVRATLPSGYRKARVEGFARPFDLDIDRLPSHIAGVVHDLTHRLWLLDANWITTDPKIRAVLQAHVGDELTLQIADWVKQVASDRNAPSAASMSGWRRMIEGFRFNTVIVAMGFKATTLLSQLAGVAPAIETLGGKDGGGLKWFGIGVSAALSRPRSTYEFMIEKSGEMRHRLQTRDRDIRQQLLALEGKTDILSQIQEVSLLGIGYMELLITMPTWTAGYRKAIEEGLDDAAAVRMGDRAVRLSQGSGAAKDLAAVATHSELYMRLLTMFYTPFSALYNRLRSIGHDVEEIQDVPRAFVRTFWTVLIAATLGELLAGHGPDKDEDWATWWARVVAMYPFLGIPLLRDALSTIVTGYGYQFSPIGQALETATNLTRSTYKAAGGEKDWEELAPQAVKAFSYLVGAPTTQLMITGKYLKDLSTGNAHPDNLFQFAHDMLYARPKE